jgi:hypothetical protein
VLTPLTRNATGPLKFLIALTGFAAQTPLDGAGTAIWAAASPELNGVTGRFWNKRHEIRCRFRNPAEIQTLRAIVEQQLCRGKLRRSLHVNGAAMSEPVASIPETERSATRHGHPSGRAASSYKGGR